ncbi:twin-arginine translocase TatA/TatE family subunit [Agarivorans aestuarii]|uniref:Sec-independent protein translocase protein TatA n=1 Tax=Agarivorans aestuarii TaxID=1563703 RepID=A0ABU7G1F5_9ALTE|nr:MULTISPECIES: twin-arginine translocase TatA/TatE family subunit [Agarivorans]MEE1673237.1 twin-arginine translocase TatA/TatE family subunit [Agarivorans aestuarii]
MAGISVWQLAIIAVIVALLFGTKRLRGLGGDLGSTIKGFKQAMSDENASQNVSSSVTAEQGDSNKQLGS